MRKDIINYQLAEGVSKEHLLNVAQRVFEEWMQHQEGFLSWEILEKEEGWFVDIVSWESEEVAQQAEESMKNIPNAEEWFACYAKESITSNNVHSITTFAQKK